MMALGKFKIFNTFEQKNEWQLQIYYYVHYHITTLCDIWMGYNIHGFVDCIIVNLTLNL